MHTLIDRFKQAAWPERIAMLVVGIALIIGGGYAIKLWLIPFLISAFAVVVRIAMTFAFITFFVSLFSPSTGKKLMDLGFKIVEKVILDPLLMLFGANKKKKDTH